MSSAPVDVVAMDGLGIVGTLGSSVPAAPLVSLVVGAVVRDRRPPAREQRCAQDLAADDAPSAGRAPRAD